VSLAACFLMLDLLQIESLKWKKKNKVKWVWLFGLIIFLFLLSARTILFATCLIIYFFLFKYLKTQKKLLLFVIVSLLSFILLSIIIYRNDVLRLRITSAFMFYEDAKYFGGGLSSRLFQWKSIFLEFLSNNIFFGVGIGDTHEMYSLAYQNFNLEWALENKFNAHSMYLEILFSSGIIGLFILFLVFIESIKTAFKYKDVKYKLFLSLFLIAGITESLLNRQFGILYFLIFNSLFYISLKYKTQFL
jgi:O-antigen ligase